MHTEHHLTASLPTYPKPTLEALAHTYGARIEFYKTYTLAIGFRTEEDRKAFANKAFEQCTKVLHCYDWVIYTKL